MPAEMTDDYRERTRLMAWRVAVLTLAILISGGSAPAIRDALGGREGYRAMGLTVAALLLIGTVGAYRGTRRAPIGRTAETSGSLRDQLRIVAQERDFRYLLTTFILQALAVGAMLAGIDYFARYILQDPSASTVLFACVVGPALLVSPLWQTIGARYGKKAGYVAASILLIAGAAGLTVAQVVPATLVYASTALVGIGFTGTQVFPMAMLPDVAAVDTARTGIRRAGVFTGIWTAGETFGLAAGPGLYALVLQVGGYVSSTTDQTVVQPASAHTAIVAGSSAVPALLITISLIPLSRYRLTEAQVEQTQDRLAAAEVR
jgi:Na+/melibiose symporter-like transporter